MAKNTKDVLGSGWKNNGGTSWTGQLQDKYWQKQIKQVKTVDDAKTLLTNLFDASNHGLGISDNDQKYVLGIVKQLGKQFDLDVSKISNIWDTKIDHINYLESSKAFKNSLNEWDQAVKKSIKKKTAESKLEEPTSDGGGGGGSTYNYYGGGGGSSSTDKHLEELIETIKANADAEKPPKPLTADEIAEYYGVQDQYNMDYLRNMYNNMTNKYYQDAIADQQRNNDLSSLETANYTNRIARDYIDSYKNAAATASGKGRVAANLLSTMLGADQAQEEQVSNLNQLINQYKETWDAELANNDLLARQYYNNIAKMLVDGGTKLNTANVKNYINDLDAYQTAYTDIRDAQASAAANRAQAYGNNAQAAVLRNAQAAKNIGNNLTRQIYQAYYGDQWQKAYNNMERQQKQTNNLDTTKVS